MAKPITMTLGQGWAWSPNSLSQLHPWLSPPTSQPGDTPRGLSLIPSTHPRCSPIPAPTPHVAPPQAPTLDVAPLAQGLQCRPPLQELAEFVPDFARVALAAGTARCLPGHWWGRGTGHHHPKGPGCSRHVPPPQGAGDTPWWPPHPARWMVLPVPPQCPSLRRDARAHLPSSPRRSPASPGSRIQPRSRHPPRRGGRCPREGAA